MASATSAETIVVASAVGPLGIESDGASITRVAFHARGVVSSTVPAGPIAQVVQQLDEYFNGRRTTFSVPLAPDGTPFQQSVWRALLDIPFGETRSYADIARMIGRPAAVRAVGAANGQNPIPIIVPCHRVIGSNGSLTGFGGGLAMKEFLLRHESRRLF